MLLDAFHTAIGVTVIVAAIGLLVAVGGLIRDRRDALAVATGDR